MTTPECSQAREDLAAAKAAVSQAHEDMNHAHFRADNAKQAADAAAGKTQAAYQARETAQTALEQYDDGHLKPGPERAQLVVDLNRANTAYDNAQQQLNSANSALSDAQAEAVLTDGNYQEATQTQSNCQNRVNQYCR